MEDTFLQLTNDWETYSRWNEINYQKNLRKIDKVDFGQIDFFGFPDKTLEGIDFMVGLDLITMS